MFDSGDRCPNCRATTLIRDEQTGPYKPGECMNCRHDRTGELPGKPTKMAKTAPEAPAANPPADMPPGTSTVGAPALPEGVKALSGNRYELPDGRTVHGKKALAAAMGGDTE